MLYNWLNEPGFQTFYESANYSEDKTARYILHYILLNINIYAN